MQAKNWIHWAICLIASPIILFAWRSPPSPSPSPDAQLRRIINTHPVYSPLLNPTFQLWLQDPPNINLRGTSYVWQIPASPIGVLFLAHGCGRTAMVFWDAHSGCPMCVGLPEERAFVIAAIERGFAVIAVSSIDVCWDVREDVHHVESILREWIGRKGLKTLPVVALGSSTGGWFVSQFAKQFRFDAIVLMVAEGRFSVVNLTSYYPPVMFVYMVKDVARAKQIRVNMAQLTTAGVPVAEFLCREVPIFPEFFSLRVPYIGNDTSAQMVEALVANGSLTGERLLKQDARWFDWSLPLEKRDLLPVQLRAPVEQELNVAFAFHEFSSLAAPEIFQWLDYQIQARNFTNPTTSS